MAAGNQTNRTSAATGGLNLTLDPVETFVFSGLQERVLEVFGAKSIWVTSTDKTKLLQRLFGSQGAGAADLNVQYPYTFLTLGSVATTETRGSVKALSTKGLYTAVTPDGDNKRAFRVKLLPTDFSVSLEYVTNSYQEVLRFVNTWMFARTNGWLRFNVAYGNLTLTVGLDMDATVSMPQREADLTNVQEYVAIANLTLQGYISFAVLQEQQIVTAVQTTTALSSLGGQAVWTF